MANIKPSQFTPKATADGTELIWVIDEQTLTAQQIADLASSAVSSVNGETGAVVLTAADVNAYTQLETDRLIDRRYLDVDASGDIVLDLALYRHFTLYVEGDITSITFTNIPSHNVRRTEWSLTLRMGAAGNYSVAQPSNIDRWEQGRTWAAINTDANAINYVEFIEAGITRFGSVRDTGNVLFATPAQGALADNAVQPGDDADRLGSGTAGKKQVLTADGEGGASWSHATPTVNQVDPAGSTHALTSVPSTVDVLTTDQNLAITSPSYGGTEAEEVGFAVIWGDAGHVVTFDGVDITTEAANHPAVSEGLLVKYVAENLGHGWNVRVQYSDAIPAAATYRYYRLNITANNTATRTALAEVEFIAGGVDVAVGGTASADSFAGVGEEADKAFDDDEATQWVSDLDPNHLPSLVEYDLGAGNEVALDSYTLAVKRSSDEDRAPRDWTLEGSNDGTTWTTLDTVAGETGWDTAGGTVLAKRSFTVGGGGSGEASSQQFIADNELGVTGWALLKGGDTPDPSWTTVSPGGLQAAIDAASPGETLYLDGGDFDLSDAPVVVDGKQLTILGNFDGTTRLVGYKDLTAETWTDNGDGTWTLDVGALGLTIRPPDPNHDATAQGHGNERHAYPQQVFKDEQVGWHYANTTDLAAAAGGVGYDFPGGAEGYVLDDTNDIVHINYDPAAATSVYLAYSEGLLFAEGFVGFVLKGLTFAFDGSDNRGPARVSGIAGTHPVYSTVINCDDSLAEYCDWTKNHAGGVKFWSGGCMVRHTRFRWHGMNGLEFKGSPRSVLLNSEVARNGWACSMGDVGGGFKMKQLETGDPDPYSTPVTNYLTALPGDGSSSWNRYGTLVYHIWSHNNYGPGIWYDGDCIYGQVERNLCEDDWGSGILIEVSEHNIVRENHVYRCGGSKPYTPTRIGIHLELDEGTSTYKVLAENNYVEDCPVALGMSRADRSSYDLRHATFRNNHVKSAVPLLWYDGLQNVNESETPYGTRGVSPNNRSLDPTLLDLEYSGNYYEVSTHLFGWHDGNNHIDENEAEWQTRFASDSVASAPSGVPALADVGLFKPPEQ